MYRKGKVWVVNVPQRHGGPKVRVHVGTTDKNLAERVEAMCEELATLREWTLLEGVTGVPLAEGVKLATGDKRRTRTEPVMELLELFDAWTWRHKGALDKLRERLDDVDLERYVEEWLTSKRSTPDTAARYEVHVRTLMPEGTPFPRSALTYRRIVQWLADLKVTDAEGHAVRVVKSSTRRRYRAALSSFCEHLIRAEVLTSNPAKSVKAPKADAPRRRYLAHHDVIKLVEKQEGPYRLLSALMHGTGMEISAALRVKRADVDTLTKKIRAHGTKTRARDREVYVDAWAWPYVEAATRTLTPAALLFPGVDRWRAGKSHRAACTALGEDFADYRMHDIRHTYAVRAIRAGAPLEHVARQLGHANTQMVVNVYGRFQPNESERREWEKIAALQDAERAKAATR